MNVGDASSSVEGVIWCNIDFVILNLYLGGLERFRILEEITFLNPELPIIIVTAYDSFEGDSRLGEPDIHVVKSIEFAELKVEARQMLGR